MGWNFGDLYDVVGEVIPGAVPALLHGDRVVSWGEFSKRSNNLGAQLLARGAAPGDKLALYMRNRPEYLETLAACFKARQVHVNINYRFLEEELFYILDNSDARTLVFSSEFLDQVTKLRHRLRKLESFIQLGGTCAPFAESYEALATQGTGEPLGLERSADDLLFLYTGGTTGRPKAVMWPHDALWKALSPGASRFNGNRRADSLTEHREMLRELGPGPRTLPACPLMHGPGLFASMAMLAAGGSIVTLPSATFDPVELWQTVQRYRVQSIMVVGDAFAKPMLRALDERPHAYDLGSLEIIISSGVMFSSDVKTRLLQHRPGMTLLDTFGSSEAINFGNSLTTEGGVSRSGKFRIGENCKVFTADLREVKPGGGEIGLVACRGSIPIGYYKDPEKTAEVFPVIDGVRYAMPGDWCAIEPGENLTLLGRGSLCINSGGEKIYPEEVEQVLKTHPDVYDAVLVGVPDASWGQAVTALVELQPGCRLDAQMLREHVRARLAGFKVPKHVFQLDTIGRAANGKADYVGLRLKARGLSSTSGSLTLS